MNTFKLKKKNLLHIPANEHKRGERCFLRENFIRISTNRGSTVGTMDF